MGVKLGPAHRGTRKAESVTVNRVPTGWPTLWFAVIASWLNWWMA
jgi:hypothetical protein